MNAFERLNIKMDESKKTVHGVLGVSEEKKAEIIESVRKAVEGNERITGAIKELLMKYDGAEAVLAVLGLGLWIGVEKMMGRTLAVMMLGEAALQGLEEAMGR